MKGTLILLPLTWYLHETFHSSTPPQICLTKCSPHLKIIHPTLKQQQPNTLTHLSFPCRTQLNQASGGNALLQTNSHKNDWIPAGESSVSTLGEKMKKNEVIREIFDTEKAPARSQPASLFVLTLPVLLNSLIFLKVSPQFLHQHTRKIQRSPKVTQQVLYQERGCHGFQPLPQSSSERHAVVTPAYAFHSHSHEVMSLAVEERPMMNLAPT